MRKMLVAALIVAPSLLAQGPKPEPQAPWRTSPAPAAQIGRYVAIQPQQNGSGNWSNFLWVLDTSTGVVTAYRIANFTDENGKSIGFMTERLESAFDYYMRTTTPKN